MQTGSTLSQIWVVGRKTQWYATPQLAHPVTGTPWLVEKGPRPTGPWRKIASSGFGLHELRYVFTPLLVIINRVGRHPAPGSGGTTFVFGSCGHPRGGVYRTTWKTRFINLNPSQVTRAKQMRGRFGPWRLRITCSLANGLKILRYWGPFFQPLAYPELTLKQ